MTGVPAQTEVATIEATVVYLEAPRQLAFRKQMLGQRLMFATVQSHLERPRLVDPREVDPAMRLLARTGGRYA